jgi:hypothetical protein
MNLTINDENLEIYIGGGVDKQYVDGLFAGVTGTTGVSKTYVDDRFNVLTGITSALDVRVDALEEHAHLFSNFNNQNLTLSLSQGVPVKITNTSNDLWSPTGGTNHYHLFNNSGDTIITEISAHYLIQGSMTFRSIGGGGEYKLSLLKNEGQVIAIWQAESTVSQFLFNVAFTTGGELTAGDGFYFEFTNTSSSNDVSLINASMAVSQVHRT